MNMKKSVLSASLALLLVCAAGAFAQSVDLSATGSWSMVQDWEGEPFGYEWDSGIGYGLEGSANLIGITVGGRWNTADFDLNGIETNLNETWNQTNLEAWGGMSILGTPLYILGGYRHWTLEIEQSNIADNLTFSFDGIGIGAAVKWEAPASDFFLNAHAMYYIELSSDIDNLVANSGFDYVLMMRAEIGYWFDMGFYTAVGAEFNQIHQDLPEENRVAPFVDYGFEQTSITARIGFNFGL